MVSVGALIIRIGFWGLLIIVMNQKPILIHYFGLYITGRGPRLILLHSCQFRFAMLCIPCQSNGQFPNLRKKDQFCMRQGLDLRGLGSSRGFANVVAGAQVFWSRRKRATTSSSSPQTMVPWLEGEVWSRGAKAWGALTACDPCSRHLSGRLLHVAGRGENRRQQ